MGEEKNTDKSRNLSVKITGAENNLLTKLRRHYGFTSDADLVRALIKRASMNL